MDNSKKYAEQDKRNMAPIDMKALTEALEKMEDPKHRREILEGMVKVTETLGRPFAEPEALDRSVTLVAAFLKTLDAEIRVAGQVQLINLLFAINQFLVLLGVCLNDRKQFMSYVAAIEQSSRDIMAHGSMIYVMKELKDILGINDEDGSSSKPS